ncbi:MAG: Fic family protein [Opitutales bacterium]
MTKPYLWQDSAFPHFYSNPAVVAPLEASFKQAVTELDARISKQNVGFADVLTEEIVSNSEIEGVLLDRESVHSSFVENIIPAGEKELGAVQLTRMALNHQGEPLSHELLFEMHRAILLGASGFPEASIGAYVGDMKIVSGTRIDREQTVIHEGVSKTQVHDKMTEFIEWYNQCMPETPLLNAIQGHVHFETLHPFCDGNGRIGRSLILMSLCRDLGRSTPLALSRSFNQNLERYYKQFSAPLDLTQTVRDLHPIFLKGVAETGRILELTAYRTKVSDQAATLNERQLKVLNRLIDYELKGGFEGGMNNTKYQKMTDIGDRTALRDLSELHERGLIVKIGQLKGTRYYLNVPNILERL